MPPARKKPRFAAKIDKRSRYKVTFLKSKYTFVHADERRTLTGLVGNINFPFPIKQLKLIECPPGAVKKGFVVGNHRHIGNSGQWEIVVILGDGKAAEFRFRYKNFSGNSIHERKLRAGDVVVIPPGCTLAFRPVRPNARLLEISNQAYDAKNFAKEALF